MQSENMKQGHWKGQKGKMKFCYLKTPSYFFLLAPQKRRATGPSLGSPHLRVHHASGGGAFFEDAPGSAAWAPGGAQRLGRLLRRAVGRRRRGQRRGEEHKSRGPFGAGCGEKRRELQRFVSFSPPFPLLFVWKNCVFFLGKCWRLQIW